MDYSSFYLKNYRDEDDSVEINYRNEAYRYYRQEKEMARALEPQVIYAQPVETFEEQQAFIENGIDDDDVKRERKGRWSLSGARRFFIAFLCVIIGVLATFVTTDFVTRGGVVSAFSAALGKDEDAPPAAYLLSAVSFDKLDAAKLYATQLRLTGGAGYILRRGEAYCVVANVYFDEKTATEIKEKNSGSELITLSAATFNEDAFEKDVREAAKSAVDLLNGLSRQLNDIATDTVKSLKDKQAALEAVSTLCDKVKFEAEYFEKLSDVKNDAAMLLLSDLKAAEGMLDNLLNDRLSRPNLVCDIRYYSVQTALGNDGRVYG